VTKLQERAQQLENQLSDLLTLINRDDFVRLYKGDVNETRALLEKHLTSLRADMTI